MESNLGQRRRGLEDKIPDFRKTLDMVEVLGGRGLVSLVSFFSWLG